MAAQMLIWTGTGLAALGVVGILWCMLVARAARRQGDAALRERLRRLVPVNLAALGVATLGLICVILGIVLRA